MRYKATAKFKELSRINHHSGLDKGSYEELMAGMVVTLKIVPSRLIERGYIKEYKESKKKENK